MPHVTPLNAQQQWPFYTATITSGTAVNITTWQVWNTSYTSAATTTITQGQIVNANWPFNQIIAGTTATNTLSINHYAWTGWNGQHEELRELLVELLRFVKGC